MKGTQLHLRVTAAELAELDEAAARQSMSRSDFVRAAIAEAMNTTEPEPEQVSRAEAVEQITETVGGLNTLVLAVGGLVVLFGIVILVKVW